MTATSQPDPQDQAPSSASQVETPPDVAIDGLENELAQVIAERDANFDKLLRTQADFENYRKRVNKDRDEDRKFAPYGLIRDLLPALDNLRRAVDAATAAGETGTIVQGVSMVLKQIDEVFERNGAKPIVSTGTAFDPNLHEAIAQVPSPAHEPMTVLQEAERGYTLHERVIRPSKVIVSSKPQ